MSGHYRGKQGNVCLPVFVDLPERSFFVTSLLFTWSLTPEDKLKDHQKKNGKLSEAVSSNLTNQIFLTSIGAWLTGKRVDTRLRGSKLQMEALVAATEASLRLQEVLNAPSTTIEVATQAMRDKRKATDKFEFLLGMKWPLSLMLFFGASSIIFCSIFDTVA